NHPAAHIGGKAFSRAPQVQWIDAGQVVAPETELGHGQKPDQENAAFQQIQVVQGGIKENDRQQDHPRNLEYAQQLAPAQNADRQIGERESPDEAADLLPQLHSLDGLLLRVIGQVADPRQTGNDARQVLDRSESGPIATGEHQGSYDGSLAQGW